MNSQRIKKQIRESDISSIPVMINGQETVLPLTLISDNLLTCEPQAIENFDYNLLVLDVENKDSFLAMSTDFEDVK